MEWIRRQIKDLQLATFEDIYFKSETFKGMLFCKYNEPEDAEKMIKEFNKCRLEFKASDSVFKPWFN